MTQEFAELTNRLAKGHYGSCVYFREYNDFVRIGQNLRKENVLMPRLNGDLDYPYNLLKDILSRCAGFSKHNKELPEMQPCDFTGSVEYVLYLLEPQERKIIKLRYKQRMTYQGIGDLMGLSRERVRQVIQKAQWKIHHPSRWKYIKYGVKGIEDMALNKTSKSALLETTPVIPEEIKLEDLNLSVRSYHCLARAGIKNVADIIDLGEGLHYVRNLGKYSFNEIITRLKELGINCDIFQLQ